MFVLAFGIVVNPLDSSLRFLSWNNPSDVVLFEADARNGSCCSGRASSEALYAADRVKLFSESICDATFTLLSS